MLTNLAFTVLGQPQGKGRARSTRSGRHYTPAKTVSYEARVAHSAALAMSRHSPMAGPLTVEIVAVFGIPKSWSKKKWAAAERGEIRPTCKPDADNIGKAIADGGNGVAWVDDAQIVDMRVIKRYGLAPAVFVNVAQG